MDVHKRVLILISRSLIFMITPRLVKDTKRNTRRDNLIIRQRFHYHVVGTLSPRDLFIYFFF